MPLPMQRKADSNRLLPTRKLLPIALDPICQLRLCLIQLVAVDQPTLQSLEECAGSDVVCELVVLFSIRPGGVRWKKFLVQGREPALDTAQAQAALASDRPIRKSEREISQCLGLKLGKQRALERILECRVDHVRTVFENGRGETEKPAV